MSNGETSLCAERGNDSKKNLFLHMGKAELFETHTVFFFPCHLQRLFIPLVLHVSSGLFPSIDKGIIQLALADSYFFAQKGILHARINFFLFFFFFKHHLEPVKMRSISEG